VNEASLNNIKNNHAIVIGGSMAGLAAAKVLSKHFRRVTVIERDQMPEGANPHKGVPQGRHPHALLKRGELILDEIFPGLIADLISKGAFHVNSGKEFELYMDGVKTPTYESKISMLALSRPLIENTIRQHLLREPNIRFIQEVEVTGVEADPTRTYATGIRVRGRNGVQIDTTDESLFQADLIVDASGKESHMPQWLESLGYSAPTESKVACNMGYSSRIYKRPEGLTWTGFYAQPKAPHRKRGAIMLPMEGNDRLQVTLMGMAGDYAPTDEEGFKEFARSLPEKEVYELISTAEPLTSIVGYRKSHNQLRNYHEMPRYLEGLIALGDAVCAFNPVFGQGMSAAAIGADTLDKALSSYQPGESEASSFAEYFQKQLIQGISVPWQLATGEDLMWYPEQMPEMDHETRLIGQYMMQVQKAATTNPYVMEVFYQVLHLLEAPNVFFRPDIVLQVVNEMVAA
jgi:2-polyprenyl-6-methoxyphenol hydroxylase-like FAD-dependent oxidoreductase